MKSTLAFVILILSSFSAPRCGATVYHSDGSAVNVQLIHDIQAIDGDTITIPAGNFIWGAIGVHVTKALTIQGAGQGTTNITVTANPTITLTKTVNGPIRVQQLSFTGVSGGVFPDFITVDGPWPSGKPVIFQNVTFNAHGSTLVGVESPGGVIFSHIAFVGEWDNALVTVKHNSSASWTTPDTMGARDTTGSANVYIEDSTFVGGSNGITDCDDGCRMVLRHNIFGYGGRDSGGPNSHGQDTSSIGMRHMEIYDNQFLFPDHTCNNCGNQCLSNVNQFIWIRGGTGVIFDNYFDHLSSQCWGTKTEIRFDIRGAEDVRPQGSCANTHYPVPHQIGQSNTGTDPIWIWGNTGQSVVNVQTAWSWGNPCGFDWNTFFQWHRDAENTSLPNPLVLPPNGGGVSGLGGTAKPGYTPYIYPHPLATGSPPPTPTVTPPPSPTPTSTPTQTPTPAPSPTSTPTQTPTPAPSPTSTPTAPILINCGGLTYLDSLGQLWSADMDFVGGSTYSTAHSITGTLDPTLYQSERYGPTLTYNIPVVNDTYTVTLYFAEIWFDHAGWRVFNVSIEGQTVLQNFDIWAVAGQFAALQRTFVVTVTDGVLNIVGTAIVNNAKFSAIQVVPGSAAPTPTPTATATTTVTPTPTSTPTPDQCEVPNFIGANVNHAQAIWNDAGFTTEVIILPGPNNWIDRHIDWQSLPEGFIGSCSETTITVQ